MKSSAIPGPSMKTRERILVTSLELFNAYGEPNVTTIHIANEMDISPGNLYYHFRNKDEITLELFGRFEEAMLDLLGDPGDRDLDMEDLWLYLHMVFENIVLYRFLYRNLVDLLSRVDRLRSPFQRIMNRKRETALGLCEGLVRQEMMRATPDELDVLTHNIVMTATFWLNYQQIHETRQERLAHIGHGVFQVLSLPLPYLAEEQREYLLVLSKEYLD